MYSPGHQDPTAAVTKAPGNNYGGLKPSMDRHRTASTRLSCISEHQKENTPNSEDDGCLPSTRAIGIKTPLLEPVRYPHSHHRLEDKSRESEDGSSISPFQLDPEKAEAVGNQVTHNLLPALSTWPCAAPSESKARVGQYDALDTRPFRPAPPELLGVQWQTIRWTDTHPKLVHIKEHRRTLSATGFDGPRSSTGETSPLHSPANRPSSPLGSLPLGNCLPCKSRKLKSDTSGSIDWEKSWPKRKPRRRHDVSESSEPDTLPHRHTVDPPVIGMESEDTTSRPKLEGPENQSRPCNVQDCVFKSCPEFYRRSPTALPPSTSRFRPDSGYGLESPNYSQFDNSHHRYRPRMPERVSRRIRSIRDRLYRGRSSSMYSIRPEFPPPPDGVERRYRSRNSNDIWPSSGEESPIFNTPESNISPMQPAGHHADLLAASGLLIATAELDRLTASANNTPRTSAATSLEMPRASGFTRSLELPRVHIAIGLEVIPQIPRGNHSSQSGSGSSVADTAPVVPSNSPSSLSPPTRFASPMSRSPKRVAQKGRRQRSRLSEVTTPDEVSTSVQLSDASDITQDVSQSFEDECDEGLIPRPLSISRPPSSNDKPISDHSLTMVSAVIQHIPDPSEVTVGPGIAIPERISSRGQTPEPRFEQTDSYNGDDTEQCIPGQAISVKRPSIKASRSEPIYPQSMQMELEIVDMIAQESALLADAMAHLKSIGNTETDSCHPDTWSEDQGEPGDSEPFCPPECLTSNRCSHDSEPQKNE
ncbi:hypothetical protein O1611_g9246 [Lasiodiplodia mahajangana]|uniref:Uncharacterized protein n=1 Tax=Lasiodiplodia mahajangana TaxID=1108764 RepID=A0ACC2JAI6_9PEZI|nr:hypothetical protein O1611_g9246 [Lasiodiplodia mahajangana]